MGLPQKATTHTSSPTTVQLREFVPIYSLDPERQQELAKHARCLHLSAGTKIFGIGDEANYIFYLLSGEVELRNTEERFVIVAGSEQAQLPLDAHNPHQYMANVISDVEIIIIERNLMDILLTWDPYGGYVVDEIDTHDYDPDDWMTTILQSPVFQRIPPINIQIMFQKLQSYSAAAHDVIFLQGEEGDFFYLIQEGTCEVIRSQSGKDTVIARLKAGDAFGEEALISSDPRNASVVMRDPGTLLRLAKTDFENLFKRTLVETIDLEQADQLSERNPLWIDVRQPEEHSYSAIEGSLNLPLNRLRDFFRDLPFDRPCIIYCDNGHRSSCAAYLLNATGHEAYVLENGLQAHTPEASDSFSSLPQIT